MPFKGDEKTKPDSLQCTQIQTFELLCFYVHTRNCNDNTDAHTDRERTPASHDKSSNLGFHVHFYRSCWLECPVNQTGEKYFHLQYQQLHFTFQETRQECDKHFHWLVIPFDPQGGTSWGTQCA